ncbi:DUF6055 domain-containing protein [Vibrio mangrovi]|uniref:DUF6055 domain-containing protein n=1 Tax=Vibrio mangrovi TaxID=474394 RepID=A0A1Y6IMZ5_9VIBR|nr:DUF6055 domain-containing protein [Vibrio mangrovi]MDW6004197.1 DUF6055 domain-containing protein [Vibrio mangrovi]SMR99006.1 Fibronectin type III domain protein [Vibrio mangrovi]
MKKTRKNYFLPVLTAIVSATPALALADLSLNGSAGNGEISLNWSGAGADSIYQVYYDTDSNPAGRTRLATLAPSTHSYTASNLNNGTQYWFWVKYQNDSGDWLNSSVFTATPSAGGLSLTGVAGDRQVQLNWNNAGSGGGYQIYYDTDSNPAGRSRAASVSESTHSYTVTNLNNGTPYWFWIKYRDNSGNMVSSEAFNATPVSSSGGGSSGGGSSSADSYDASLSYQWQGAYENGNQDSCVSGNWQTPSSTGDTGQPLRAESTHFAVYWADGTNINTDQARTALNTLEHVWSVYYGNNVKFQEPYCNSSQKFKATVHFGNDFALTGGGWFKNGNRLMGMWVGPGAAADQWGLAHEFAHGAQFMTTAFPGCNGLGCWIHESHANWMAHQVFPDNAHCSEMLVNTTHLHYGNTRTRYCNWQFFEYLKDKFGPGVVGKMWSTSTYDKDEWQKLMANQGWDIKRLNDEFGDWAMHNVTWDYLDINGTNRGAYFRDTYGAIDQDPGANTQRRLRLTQLETLDNNWRNNHRFVSPYYWAPQRWGYNIVRLYPEQGASSVTVNFRGVVQQGADSDWRWGLVATDRNLNSPRYSRIQRGNSNQASISINNGDEVYLVVMATPTQYQKILWARHSSDGTPYPSIYRYPYMVEVQGAWPDGFRNGAKDACPSGTVRHGNGGGCAPQGTPSSVYVGPYAKVLGGTVRDNARIEDHATIVHGTVSGNAVVGAMTLLGSESTATSWYHTFDVSDNATVKSTFYPMGWFGDRAAGGTVTLLGDLEYYSNKYSNFFYGLVDDRWNGDTSINDITVRPPYSWR